MRPLICFAALCLVLGMIAAAEAQCGPRGCHVGRWRGGYARYESNGKTQVTYEVPRRPRGGRDGRWITPFR